MVLLPFLSPSCARRPRQARRRGADVRRGHHPALAPWLDTSRVRSANYRPSTAVLLGVHLLLLPARLARLEAAGGGYVLASRIATFHYFAHFLIVMPLVGLFETPKPLPGSILESVTAPQAGERIRPPGRRRRRTPDQGLTSLPAAARRPPPAGGRTAARPDPTTTPQGAPEGMIKNTRCRGGRRRGDPVRHRRPVGGGRSGAPPREVDLLGAVRHLRSAQLQRGFQV